jgi:hypothetical protein
MHAHEPCWQCLLVPCSGPRSFSPFITTLRSNLFWWLGTVSGSPMYELSISFIPSVGAGDRYQSWYWGGLRSRPPHEVRRGHMMDHVPFYFSRLFKKINFNILPLDCTDNKHHKPTISRNNIIKQCVTMINEGS